MREKIILRDSNKKLDNFKKDNENLREKIFDLEKHFEKILKNYNNYNLVNKSDVDE